MPRLQGDQQPACVKSCPTGALTIGPKDAMIKKAYARVKKLAGKKTRQRDYRLTLGFSIAW